MATYKAFFDSSSEIRIEVEGSGGTSNAYVSDFVAALRSVAMTVASQVAQIPKDQRPTELTVALGLKALATGGFAIALSQDAVNFRVLLKWGGESDGGLLAGSIPAPPGL